MTDPTRCYEGITSGYCRNKPYRTIGVQIDWNRKLRRHPDSIHDTRCKKHWDQWHNELFTHLYGTDYKKWLNQ